MAAPICIVHHHFGVESSFEHGLSVTTIPELYEAQIDRIARDYDIIDLDILISGRLPRRPLLLTFDDAFQSTMDVIRTVIAPRGLPSVFFINPGLLEEEAISLDSTLAWAANTVGLPRLCDEIGISGCTTIGSLVVSEMSSKCACEREEIKSKILSAFGPPNFSDRAPLLLKEDLQTLTGLGVEIGNHTTNHVHCRSLKAGEFQDEIVAAKSNLEALSGTPVRSFSVPYGDEQDLTPDTLKVLRESGHEAIFLVHARSNSTRPAPDVWYRVSLHNATPGELNMKLQYEPMMRSIKHRILG